MSVAEEFNEAADEWFALEAGSFPAVPRPPGDALVAVRDTVALPVGDTAGFRRDVDAVKGALLILSQSLTGRRLAETAIAAGYQIIVDPPHLSGAGPEHEDDALGNTDHANRRINIRGTGDPLRMALVLAHELAHVSQIVNGGLDINVSSLHPLAAIRQLLAMEGDARAYEFLVAAELAYPSKDDPEERLLFPQMPEIAADTIGVSFARKVIELARPQLQEGAAPEKFMAQIFKSFYASPSLRQHYEDTILFAIETLETHQPGTLQDAALFTGAMPQEQLIARIDGHCRPYIAARAKGYIDLDEPQMAGVSAATQQRLSDFETLRHENPGTRGQRPWQGPVYRVQPVSRPAAPAP